MLNMIDLKKTVTSIKDQVKYWFINIQYNSICMGS